MKLKETGTPKKNGKARDTRVTKEPLLLEIMGKRRRKKVAARKLDLPIFPRNNRVPTATPKSSRTSSSLEFSLVPDFAGRFCEREPNLE